MAVGFDISTGYFESPDGDVTSATAISRDEGRSDTSGAGSRQPPETAQLSPENELDHLKGTFLSSLNHEIRTPLSGILGMADLLLETNLDEEQREYVSAARMCAESLFQILNATLEYSALEAGTLELDESEFCLRDLLDSALAPLREKADAKGLYLRANYGHGLPETMIGDAARIRDILTHLLDNAVKFTSDGGVELRIEAERSAPGRSTLTAIVKDTGPGIPQERQEQIFESFRQGEGGLARGYSGLGLGLALVRKLLALMGGHIEVASEFDLTNTGLSETELTQAGSVKTTHGSTFTVHLPLRVPGEISRDGLGSPQKESGPAILAVEDNPVGMMVLRHALKGRDIQIDSVTDGFAAVAAAKKRRYDVILMDLQMPGMDGLEATAEIRKIPECRDVPIIALTADSSDELRRECLQHGMQGFLSKPLESGLLWAAVSRHLHQQ